MLDAHQKNTFADDVCSLVSKIPRGKVMTYGQIAALCGSPRAARIVGGIAHFGDSALPWHRVVNKSGGLARAFTYGGVEAHKKLLENEGVVVIDYAVDMDVYLWRPSKNA
jgi:methylated-DNA-protein-cysteine methyltransferase related protein